MREEIDNRELYLFKLSSLENSVDRSLFLYSFDFYIHGILIHIYTKTGTVHKILEKLSDKVTLCDDEIDVFWDLPEELGMSEEEFCDESSQDCFTNKLGTIQRDFLAKNVSGHTYYTCFPLQNSDGFYNFLRWLLPSFMLKKQEVIIHSSAVINNKGRAILFLGYSGAGKTTITSLAGNRTILGDDMNRILFKDHLLYSSPGSVGGAFRATVEASKDFLVERIYWLQQAEGNEIRKMKISHAYQKIFASMVGWNWMSLEKEMEDQMINFVDKILMTHQVEKLYFRKDNEIWDFIERQ